MNSSQPYQCRIFVKYFLSVTRLVQVGSEKTFDFRVSSGQIAYYRIAFLIVQEICYSQNDISSPR